MLSHVELSSLTLAITQSYYLGTHHSLGNGESNDAQLHDCRPIAAVAQSASGPLRNLPIMNEASKREQHVLCGGCSDR